MSNKHSFYFIFSSLLEVVNKTVFDQNSSTVIYFEDQKLILKLNLKLDYEFNSELY